MDFSSCNPAFILGLKERKFYLTCKMLWTPAFAGVTLQETFCEVIEIQVFIDRLAPTIHMAPDVENVKLNHILSCQESAGVKNLSEE